MKDRPKTPQVVALGVCTEMVAKLLREECGVDVPFTITYVRMKAVQAFGNGIRNMTGYDVKCGVRLENAPASRALRSCKAHIVVAKELVGQVGGQLCSWAALGNNGDPVYFKRVGEDIRTVQPRSTERQ